MKRILLVFFVFILSCKTKPVDSDYKLYQEYISEFSTGLVSVGSDVRVVFNFERSDWAANQVIDEKLLEIRPSVKGKTVALSNNTLAFIPEKGLDPDTEYRVSLKLSKLVKTPDELSDFHFSFKTLKQDFSVFTHDLQSYSKDYQYLNASLETSDIMDLGTASKLVEAKQGSKKLKIKFEPVGGDKTFFKFMVDSIARSDNDTKIELSWNGKPFDIDRKGNLKFEIPGRSNFKVIGMEVGDSENQSLFINFSDPIMKGQNLNGLVQVQNVNDLRFSTEGNLLKVYFSEAQKGTIQVEVFEGIESEYGYKMKKHHLEKVAFDHMKPNVRFIQSGTILPSSNNLKINFEAVSLRAVDVKVYKVHKNNILQFLQENDLNGKTNLRRVASPVAVQTINLLTQERPNYTKWNSYALDLTKVINPEPGTLYRVELSFKRPYSIFKCGDSPVEIKEDETRDKDEVRTTDDYYDQYWYEDYSWQDSQDPCKDSYYYRGAVGTNVLASNLGVIAKRGENGSYFVAVSDIVSTDAVSGAKVELYDFQQQLLISGETGSDGTVNLDVPKYAYFAVVSKGKEATYLRMDAGYSLSISNFDVAGKTVEEGLKGYIYGERGVWRPGDTLYLSFMLNDNDSRLEKTHSIKFRLTDPQGKVVQEIVRAYSPANLYSFPVSTQPNSSTGNYEAMVSVGGARFYKRIPVETIKPNRLKIKSTFSQNTLFSNKTVSNSLDVSWLHGAKGKDLKVDVQVKYSSQKTAFAGYSHYVFDHPALKFQTEETQVFSGKTGADGKVSYNLQPKVTSQAPGMLRATFLTKAYEQGGDFSTDVGTINYSPYNTYVGLKTPEPNKYGLLETGKNNRFEVVTVDENGSPKAVLGLKAKVYKVSWRWWWDASYDNLSSYVSSNSTEVFKTFDLNTDSKGKASFSFTNNEDQWGRYLVLVSDPQGHTAGQTVLIDWPYWSGKSRNTDATHASMLVFSTDKKSYEVGQTSVISFPSSEGGRALISVEGGSKVIKTSWVNTTAGETKVNLPITPDMAPNVFVHITLLQPHASTLNDSPIRMYGIVPIEVLDKNTQLQPQISMPEVLRPEQAFNLKVSEKSGKAMSYSIAVVDEGLLDLTRFKTPNPWDEFYSRQALGVKTWDVYNDVVGAYGGRVNQIFAIGGDEDLKGGNAQKLNRFKPCVVYLGPFTLDKGKTASHKIDIPNYIGSVRAMVVAGDPKAAAYGSAEKAVPVRKPLMVLASLPRKISPSEKVTLPITIFALENHVKNVKVELKTQKGVKVVGNAVQNVSFASPDEKMVYFNLEVGANTGVGEVEVVATSGNEKSVYKVDVEITNPNPLSHDYVDVVLEPNESKTLNYDVFGVPGSNAVQLEVSSFPSINFNSRLDFLIRYPHGCVEQVTSGVFPQLYLAEMVDLSSNRKTEIQKNVNAGISKLSSYQISNGGFSYWNGQTSADDWGTSYVGHFMLEAEKKGYLLPSGFKSRWIGYQQRAAKEWRYNAKLKNDLAQAYRLYTLAIGGSTDLGSMNRLREVSEISNEGKLMLAGAYAIASQRQAALKLFNAASLDNLEGNYYYGSEVRNKAIALETVLLLGDTQRAYALAKSIAEALSSDQWMSTQTTAYSLYAMSKFAVKTGGKGIDIQYSQGGKTEKVKSSKAFVDRSLAANQKAVTLKNNKDNTVYIRVVTKGILPVGEEKVMQSKLAASVIYTKRNGQVLELANIEQGTEMVATVTIRNTTNERINNVALSQILPSGFEIVNTRYTDFGSFADNKADHTDIRDDRANYYFGLGAGESKVFKILLNASYLGRYYLPGMQAEAMYDNSYQVRTKGQWVNVQGEITL